MSTRLNGFELKFSAPSFSAFVDGLREPDQLRALREKESGEWFFHWREGTLYGLPEVASPTRSYGRRVTLDTDDYRHLGLLARRINARLPAKFPQYDALHRRPFAFLGKKDELVATAIGKWDKVPALVHCFQIRPRFELDARLYELRDGVTQVGLFVAVSTKWDILASPEELDKAGIQLRGLYAVRRVPAADERRLVGEIEAVRGGRVILGESYDDGNEVDASEVWIEGSRRSFKRCLVRLLGGNRYEEFERRRQDAEGKLLDGPGIERLCAKMEHVLKKNSPIAIAPDITCTVVGRIQPTNVAGYKSVVDVGAGEYCFDPAKTKRTQYAWPGIERFGPYSRDTFPKKSPRLLVVTPDNFTGKVGQFVRLFEHGITSIDDARYAGGFAKLFHLHNPKFVTASVTMRGSSAKDICSEYRKAIEATLRKNSSSFDGALVAIPDEYAQADDSESPYLHSKAALLMAGVPTQEFRVSTATGLPYGLQYILQNLSLSMYAKMGGVPWTVDQGLAVDDEVVIGMGIAEVGRGRFVERQRYVGITTVFRGDGNYLLGHLSRDCSYDDYPSVLEENTALVLEELRERNGWRRGDTVRVVFHAHKPLKRIEVARIVKKSLERVGEGLQLQFAFLSILHEHPFKVIDPDYGGVTNQKRRTPKARMVPQRGRVVQLGRFTRLVCTKGPTLIKRSTTPLPSPLLVKLHDESTYRDLQYLSEQVLKFTNLSWRGTQPTEDPVTIYYSELIADLLARLRNVNGWSPSILNTSLRHSMWFL